MRQVFEQRRDLIVRRINAMPGVSCLKPSGAFYVMMNLEQIIGKQIDGQVIGSGDDFAKLLLKKSLVVVVPGSGFWRAEFCAPELCDLDGKYRDRHGSSGGVFEASVNRYL